MKLLPYFRWYPADAESDDKYSAMTDEELGFFHRCLNKSWINGGLPADPAKRAQVMRTPQKIADRIWSPECWMQNPEDVSKVVNPRQEVERKAAQELSKSRAKAAQGKSNCSTNDEQLPSKSDIRAYGSVYESSDDLRKNKVVDFQDRFMRAWNRHGKNRGGRETVNLVAQRLLDVDWDRWDERHIPFCEYWKNSDWKMCTLSMLEWWENGMPLPPPQKQTNGAKRRNDGLDEVFRECHE